MDVNRDNLPDRWHELRGLVRQKWNKLSEDDLARLNGKTEELAAALQERYGYGKAQAKIEINDWLCEQEEHAKN